MDYLDDLVVCPARELQVGDEVINYTGKVRSVNAAGTKTLYVEFGDETDIAFHFYGVVWDGDRDVVRRCREDEI